MKLSDYKRLGELKNERSDCGRLLAGLRRGETIHIHTEEMNYAVDLEGTLAAKATPVIRELVDARLAEIDAELRSMGVEPDVPLEEPDAEEEEAA